MGSYINPSVNLLCDYHQKIIHAYFNGSLMEFLIVFYQRLSQNFSFWESNLKIRSFVRLKV
jgi:hypothetical protein